MVSVLCEFPQNCLKDTTLIPPCEPNMNGFPRAEAIGQVPPRDAGLGDIENRIHKCPIGQTHRSSGPASFGGQEVFNPGPFLVAKFVAMHRKERSWVSAIYKFFAFPSLRTGPSSLLERRIARDEREVHRELAAALQ
jgi:hypothetical protein